MYGRTVRGQGIVDSGANFWAWQKGVRKLMSNTIDHESKVIGYDGKKFLFYFGRYISWNSRRLSSKTWGDV